MRLYIMTSRRRRGEPVSFPFSHPPFILFYCGDGAPFHSSSAYTARPPAFTLRGNGPRRKLSFQSQEPRDRVALRRRQRFIGL